MKKNKMEVDLTGFVRVDGALCLQDGYIMGEHLNDETIDSYARYNLATSLAYSINANYETINEQADKGVKSARKAKPLFEQNLTFTLFIRRIHELVDSLSSTDIIAALLIPMLVSAQAVLRMDIIDSCKTCRSKGVRVPVGYGAGLLSSCRLELIQVLGNPLYEAIFNSYHHQPVLAGQASSLTQINGTDYQTPLIRKIAALRARTVNIQQQLADEEEQRQKAAAMKQASKVTVETMLSNAAKRSLDNEISGLLRNLSSGQYESWRSMRELLTGNAKLHEKNIRLHELMDEMLDNREFDINSASLPKQVSYVSNLLSIADKYDAREKCENCQLFTNMFGEDDNNSGHQKTFCKYPDIFRRILTDEEYDRASKDAGFTTVEDWMKEIGRC